jgi:hypothetical protein
MRNITASALWPRKDGLCKALFPVVDLSSGTTAGFSAPFNLLFDLPDFFLAFNTTVTGD